MHYLHEKPSFFTVTVEFEEFDNTRFWSCAAFLCWQSKNFFNLRQQMLEPERWSAELKMVQIHKLFSEQKDIIQSNT